MSWNLFGSPYLCAMNYSDLQYGRVLYGYENGYKTVNTSNNTTVEGHIPSGSAVFTQTATLKDAEIFTVAQPTGSKSGDAFENMTSLSLAISPVGSTRTTDDEETVADVLQLNAVESSEARTDFDMGADGVKWMAEDRPQIYAEQNGGRYSLLSAVDKEGSVQIGLSVPQTGTYSLYIPADCDAYDYETVVLEDKQTGTLTDLKAGAYTFNAPQAGDLNDRFQLYFNRSVDEAESNIRVVSTTAGQARVLGIQPGDVIRVYNTQGMLVEQRKADATEATFSLPRGIHLFKVTTADGDVVKKAAVR
ncbi:T9SS type A sorting domain-containing protein [uncultured Bacteroides sp.]|uniref:T9SS type A sorting domain-containing protein n=1 Tax=uncultured Bacteroides sp. TaxID=162156 RepID=UPI00261BD2C6|nr:T9SS type A sorting domain-containing protein [uncultured Bacteroides sp.]